MYCKIGFGAIQNQALINIPHLLVMVSYNHERLN